MILEIDVTGADQAGRMFEGVSRRARDPRPAWPAVAAVLARGEREAFATHGASLGLPWKPLKTGKPATLRQSGALAASLASPSPAGMHATRLSLRFGTPVFYARFQARERTFVGANARTRDDVRDVMAAYIVHGRTL